MPFIAELELCYSVILKICMRHTSQIKLSSSEKGFPIPEMMDTQNRYYRNKANLDIKMNLTNYVYGITLLSACILVQMITVHHPWLLLPQSLAVGQEL